jgi:cob(I)alamin adenosyltransferase
VNAELAPLDSFVLPGGVQLAGQLQVCRAVCRRGERRVVAGAEVSPEIVAYLNRLSDLLFILARAAQGGAEELWQPWSRFSLPAGRSGRRDASRRGARRPDNPTAE